MSHPLADKLRDMAKNIANHSEYNEGLREAADEIDMYTEPIVVTYPNDNAVDYLGLVHDFHQKYNHYISDKPSIPSQEIVELRDHLIEEEMEETLTVLRDLMNFDVNDEALIELADGIADSLVVLFGTALSFGIPIGEVFKEIHRSNMTKSTEKNVFGKTVKGNKYEPPKIREILERSMK